MQRVRQAQQAPFGGVVGRRVGPGALGSRGRDVHDVAPGAAHRGHRMLGHVEGPGQVGAHHALPVAARQLADRHGDVDGRVVHQHIEPAEALAHLRDGALDLGLVAHVQRHPGGLDAALDQRVGALGRQVGLHVGDDQAGAGLAQRLGDGRAQAARAAGDDDRLALERGRVGGVLHERLPRLRRLNKDQAAAACCSLANWSERPVLYSAYQASSASSL